jgi:signal peptidase II
VTSCGRTLAGSAVTPGRRDRGAPLAEQQPDEHAVPDEPAPRRRRTGLLLTLAVLVLALDVVSKLLVVRSLRPGQDVRELGGLVYLTQLRNVGAAFSFAEGATVLFTVIAVVVAAVIVRTARRLRSAAWATALGLVLGGAIGNLVDRLFRAPGFGRGGVVDWISVFAPDGRVWPVFNLADSAIVCGGILGALLAVLGVEFDGTRGHRRPAERR